MKNLLFIILCLLSTISFSQNNCSEVFALAVNSVNSSSDSGYKEKSNFINLSYEDFIEFRSQNSTERKRSGALSATIKLITFSLGGNSDKSVSRTEYYKAINNVNLTIKQIGINSWSKKNYENFLPESLARLAANAFSSCTEGFLDMEKYKEKIQVELTQINSNTKLALQENENLTKIRLQENENEFELKLKEDYREKKIDEYDYILGLKKLEQDGLTSKRYVELEKYRIDAKRLGLNYEIKIRDNTTIDVVIEYIKKYKTSPEAVTITKIERPGLEINLKPDEERLVIASSSKEIIIFKVPENVNEIDILIKTDLGVPIRYRKNLSSNSYKGTKTYNGGEKYIGDLVADIPHGKGSLITENYIYEGILENGKMISGKKRTKAGELVYDGSLKNGKPHGNGIYYYRRNGFTKTYKGVFKNGYIKSGVCLFGENSVYFKYVGEFDKGMDGKGKLIWKDGTIFEGEFIEGKRSKGKLTYNNGDYYIGSFLNDNRHGKGKYYKKFTLFGKSLEWLLIDGIFKNGDIYQGEQFDRSGNVVSKWEFGTKKDVEKE